MFQALLQSNGTDVTYRILIYIMIEITNHVNDKGIAYTNNTYHRDDEDTKVGIIFGHFSPFTGPNGHGRMIDALQKVGCEKFLISIPSSKQEFDTDRNMFNVNQRRDICQKYLDDEGLEGTTIEIAPTRPAWQIKNIAKEAAKHFGKHIRPIFCFGPDRKDFVKDCCEKIDGPDRNKYEAIVLNNRGKDNVSGTKMRKYLLTDNKNSFEKETGYDNETVNMIFDLLDQNMMKYKENFNNNRKRIREGGNLTLNGREGMKSATKIQATQMTPEEFESFKQELVDVMIEVNRRYEKAFGTKLWGREDLIADGRYFAGSTRSMFQKDLKTFTTFKKKVGDFDIQVPLESRKNLVEWFPKEIVEKRINDCEFYGWSDVLAQSHTLLRFFNYPGVGTDFVQIDFEYVPFEDGVPTQFSTFAHYASWEDLEYGVKGAFTKYLVRALIGEIDTRDVILVTKKGAPKKDKASTDHLKRFLAFSVEKGVRIKYKPYIDPETGEQKMIDGKECWQETPTAESKYIQDLPEIFKLIFHYEPSEEEIKALYSFIRLLRLMKKNLNKNQIENVYKRFADLLWGKWSQRLSTIDKEEDRVWKETANDKFVEEFPELKKFQNEVAKEETYFYQTFDERGE